MKKLGAAFVILATGVLLAGCAPASMTSMVDDCGGSSVGLRADDTAIMYLPSEDGGDFEGLTCITSKLFTDKSEQYAVTLAYDGAQGTLDLTGYTVKYGSLGGTDFIAFSPN